MGWEHWGGTGSLQHQQPQPQWSITDTRMNDIVEGSGWGRNAVPVFPEQYPQGAYQMEYRNWAIPVPGEYYGGQVQMLDTSFKQNPNWEEDGSRPGFDKGGSKAQQNIYPPQDPQQQWQEYCLSNYPANMQERSPAVGMGYQTVPHLVTTKGPGLVKDIWAQQEPEWSNQSDKKGTTERYWRPIKGNANGGKGWIYPQEQRLYVPETTTRDEEGDKPQGSWKGKYKIVNKSISREEMSGK